MKCTTDQSTYHAAEPGVADESTLGNLSMSNFFFGHVLTKTYDEGQAAFEHDSNDEAGCDVHYGGGVPNVHEYASLVHRWSKTIEQRALSASILRRHSQGRI